MQQLDDLRLVRVYSCALLPTAQYLAASLERNGITCSVTNQYAPDPSQSAGTAVPELWVSESDVEKAAEIINLALADEVIQTDWTCPTCGEKLEAQFTECWNCGSIRH